MSEQPFKPLEDDEIFRYTQGLRQRVVEQLTNQNQQIPSDEKQVNLLLRTLSEMDNTVIQKKRLKIDEKASELTATMIEAAAKRLHRELYQQPVAVIEGVVQPPKLDESILPPLELVEGETEIGYQTDTYDNFMKRYKQQRGLDKNTQDEA